MRFDEDHDSPDVIDRRQEGGMRYAGGGGGGGLIFLLLRLLLPIIRTRFGFAGVVVAGVAYVALNYFGSQDSRSFRQPTQRYESRPQVQHRGQDPLVAFVSFVLDDVQSVWQAKFPPSSPYRRAKLVLFSGATNTACGLGESASGPFYCPNDQQVYIDLAFFETLKRRLGAPGDFAQAYVIAHELGHHVQNLEGTLKKVHAASASKRKGAQGLDVRVELQADCYAGVWAHSTKDKQLIEAGDLEEAMNAAEAIGDDTLQREATGRVRPETFSHGTSAQRMRWFKKGFDSGNPGACQTFSGAI